MNSIAEIFSIRCLLIPISIPHKINRGVYGNTTTYRVLYVFGFRIAVWSTIKI